MTIKAFCDNDSSFTFTTFTSSPRVSKVWLGYYVKFGGYGDVPARIDSEKRMTDILNLDINVLGLDLVEDYLCDLTCRSRGGRTSSNAELDMLASARVKWYRIVKVARVKNSPGQFRLALERLTGWEEACQISHEYQELRHFKAAFHHFNQMNPEMRGSWVQYVAEMTHSPIHNFIQEGEADE